MNTTNKLSKVKYIIVHCSATPAGRDVSAAQIRQWHKQRGFKDIGYHFVVRLDGTVENGRPVDMVGAHCLGKNKCSIGVCYVGGVKKDGVTAADTRTPEQKASIKHLLTKLKRIYPDAEIRSHRDFASKACPSFDATTEYKSLGEQPGTDKITQKQHIFPGISPLLLGLIVIMTSCKSHKSMESVNSENINIERHTDYVRDKYFQSLDTSKLEIINPVITIHKGDSVEMVFKADKIVSRKADEKQRAERLDVVSAEKVDSVTHKNDRMKSERDVPAPINVFSYVIIIALVLATFFLFKKMKRKYL